MENQDGRTSKMDERRMVAEGLGAVATTAFEMKQDDVEARAQLLAAMEAVGVAATPTCSMRQPRPSPAVPNIRWATRWQPRS